MGGPGAMGQIVGYDHAIVGVVRALPPGPFLRAAAAQVRTGVRR